MFFFFFFNDTATTEIYTLSLHDALPISLLAAHRRRHRTAARDADGDGPRGSGDLQRLRDRKSTRLNSSHLVISYAVFCLKKKKKKTYYLCISLSYVVTTVFASADACACT